MKKEDIQARIQKQEEDSSPIMSAAEASEFDEIETIKLHQKLWFKFAVLMGCSSFVGLLLYSAMGTEGGAQIAAVDQTAESRIEALEAENAELKGQSISRPEGSIKPKPIPVSPPKATTKTSTTKAPPPPTQSIKRIPVSQAPPVRKAPPQPAPIKTAVRPARTRPTPAPPTRVVAATLPVSSVPKIQPKPLSSPPPPALPVVQESSLEPLPVQQEAEMTLEEQWLASAQVGFSEGGIEVSLDDGGYDYVPASSSETIEGSYEPELIAALNDVVEQLPESTDETDAPSRFGAEPSRDLSSNESEFVSQASPRSVQGQLMNALSWAPDMDITDEIVQISLKDDFGLIPKKAVLFAKVQEVSSSNIVELDVIGYEFNGQTKKLPSNLFEVRAKGGDYLVGSEKRQRRRNNLGKKLLGSMLNGGVNFATESIGNDDIRSFAEGASEPLTQQSSLRNGFSSSPSFMTIKKGTKVEVRINMGATLL